jgi:hypothetical protein
MNRVRDASEVRKRGYRPLVPEDDDDYNQATYRHSEDMLAREANFDAPGGSSNWPYVYIPPDRSSSKERKSSVENGYLLSEESAEEEKFKLWYEKQVSSYIF